MTVIAGSWAGDGDGHNGNSAAAIERSWAVALMVAISATLQLWGDDANLRFSMQMRMNLWIL